MARPAAPPVLDSSMRTVALALIGVALSAMLAACGGGGGDPEGDARAEFKKLGFPQELTDCAIARIKKDAGSLEKYMDLDSATQQAIASSAGAKCSGEISQDEVGGLLENLEDRGVELGDPKFRASIINGMTTAGMSEDMATCIVDKMIDEDLGVSDVTDAAVVGRLAEQCQ